MVDIIGKYIASPPTLTDGVQQQVRLDSTGAVVTTTGAGSALIGTVGIDQTTPGSTNAVVNTPHSATANHWQYAAAASGISNTTIAVTFKAAHATLRNYITSIQIESDALGAATELAIRDGAAGTVIWRTKIGTGGITGGISITFPVPLKGTAATLLEVVTLTASVTGAVYFNAQGFVAA